MMYPNFCKTEVHFRIFAFLVTLITAFGAFTIDKTPAAAAATSPITPSKPSSPAPTSASSQRLMPPERESAFKVYMPDGQLKSHSIRVYVTRDILPNQNPRLQLLRSRAVTKKGAGEGAILEPALVAPSQEWIESIDGQQVGRSGTILLFDIGNIDFGYKAMIRVTPVVSWAEGDMKRVAVGTREINVGNVVAAICWTLLVVGLALLLVVVLSLRSGGNPLLLLTGVDGHLSLSQTQIACWTVAVGSVVLGYGFIKLEIPDIPPSVLALMGASLATGGIAFYQDAQKQQAAVNAGMVAVQRSLAFGDLVRAFPAGKAPELSLAKGQMLFWTVLLIVLFVSKSILDGAIWEVPWTLVALMGFSQAGYLAPKLSPQPL